MNEEVESLTRKPSNDEENQELFQQWNRALELYGCQENKLKKFKEKTLSLVKKCIPHELRHRVWPLIFENTLGLTNALYIELIERKSKGWVDYKVINQIEKDIARSFCGKTKYEVKTGLAIEVT